MGKTSSSASAAGHATGDSGQFAEDGAPSESFTPVRLRARHDGWTPARQHAFIAALGESGCVTEACAAVGKSVKSAYALRARPDASMFRQAWDVALDYAIRRLGDAALSRAIHGVARPIFFNGEQVGERRHFDERLTMFLLRYRDPVRYGAWIDDMEARRHPDGAGIVLAHALDAVLDAAHGFARRDPGRPLAEGPLPFEGPRPAEDGDRPADDIDPDDRLTLLAQMIRAASAPTPPPEQADWRSPLPVRRARRRSSPDVP